MTIFALRLRRGLLGLLLTTLALPALAQDAAPSIPEAPVRYDDDAPSPAFHQSRRAAVLEALPADAVAFFFSAPVQTRDNDVEFEYRQDSDLYYLTGTHEPGSVLVLAPGGLPIDGETVTEVLLVPPRNPMSETWEGRLYGAERAQTQLSLQKAVSNERFEEILGTLAGRDDVRFLHLPLPGDVDPGSELGRQIAAFTRHADVLSYEGDGRTQMGLRFILTMDDPQRFAQIKGYMAGRFNVDALETPILRDAVRAFLDATTFEDWVAWRRDHIDNAYADGATLRRVLDALRMVKTDEELALLQRAVDITVAAHREAFRSIEPGMREYEVEALIEYVFRRNGAEYPGFPSIVGSGENAVILHYNTNRRRMQDGDLVVMDIGAEYRGYSADVTRTAPVNGTFSPEQATIYELVLTAQEAGIAAAQAGKSFQAPHQAAWITIANGLRELGLIQEDVEVRRFFMHGTSHYLGLSVHDVGTGDALVPGTVLTVEPGLYIAPAPDVDPKWWNIGVRIEDDVLVTDGDPVVMSAGAPRTVAEIEALMRETGLGNQPAGLVEGDASPDAAPRGSR